MVGSRHSAGWKRSRNFRGQWFCLRTLLERAYIDFLAERKGQSRTGSNMKEGREVKGGEGIESKRER